VKEGPKGEKKHEGLKAIISIFLGAENIFNSSL
jgi:hypothetical protein